MGQWRQQETRGQQREWDGQQWQEIVFGRYVDNFERREGDWRIAHRVCVIDSRNTQPVNPSRLATDETRIPRGRRYPDDTVYTQQAAPAGSMSRV